MLRRMFTLSLLLLALANTACADGPKMRALIIDGQNNHGVWPKTTQMMKKYLEETGLFKVDIMTTIDNGTDPDFQPTFSDYNVVVSNYNGAAWNLDTQADFVNYVQEGGGFVVVHAADNAFSEWTEYSEMIGLGGWGGRNEQSGPYVYFDGDGKLIRDESPGGGGHHGAQHPFQIIVRDAEHPVTKGMPEKWMHAQDELYDQLRGPAEHLHVLATALADPSQGGSGHHEPMIMTIDFGKGRVFHTPMGHGDDSQECVGFIVTFQRGAEWAATGNVTQAIPDDFPTADEVHSRKFEQ